LILKPVLKVIFGVLCFGIGVALAVRAAHAFLYAGYGFSDSVYAMFGTMFLVGGYLLLRRPK
jgi:hypothetical protein